MESAVFNHLLSSNLFAMILYPSGRSSKAEMIFRNSIFNPNNEIENDYLNAHHFNDNIAEKIGNEEDGNWKFAK